MERARVDETPERGGVTRHREATEGGRGQYQAAHRLRVRDRGLLRERAAERHAQYVSRVDAELVEDGMPRRASVGMLSGDGTIGERPMPAVEGDRAKAAQMGKQVSHSRYLAQTPEYSSAAHLPRGSGRGSSVR